MAVPAWPRMEELVATAPVHVEVLPVDPAQAARVLLALQVTTASTLGGLVVGCGGLLVDHGWLRLLGGGSALLPDVATVNGIALPGPDVPVDAARPSPPGWLVVAYDVLGGVYAVDGGLLGVAPGEVCYRGPDALRWVGLGVGHTGLVEAVLGGALTEFAADLRWPGWQAEVAAVGADRGLATYPPPFTFEGRDLSRVSRRPVPFAELLSFYDDLAGEVRPPRPEGVADDRDDAAAPVGADRV